MPENIEIKNEKERKRMEIKSLHTHVDIVSRSKGRSVPAKAVYNARNKLKDEYHVKIYDYSKKYIIDENGEKIELKSVNYKSRKINLE